MRRIILVLTLGIGTAAPAAAQQSFSFHLGGFSPRSADARVPGDVLVNNLSFLAFNIKDFKSASFGGEYLVGLGDKFEGGLGIGFQTRTVPTVYLDFTNANGAEIEQELKLRMVPFSATVRFLPLGHHNAVTPYIGVGAGVFAWRYSEAGEFLATDSSIFRDRFVGSGTATGPVILGGLRAPVSNWDLGFEIRYQDAKGDLPADQGFSGGKIDLGGFTYAFTANIKF
jgi:opacity protein-like surface antigen